MDFSQFQQRIGVVFHDQNLLKLAFIHRSYINENRDETEHNERLEFLGDAVLELVSTEYLYGQFDAPEGELTNLRSAIVKRETLAEVARDIALGEFLFLSRGEERSGGREKDYILANTVEALIGAVYLDQGYEIARQFILRFIIIKLDLIIQERRHIDAKSFFQEKAQEVLSITPEYRLMFEEGPDHNKTFTMGVYLDQEFIAQGKGSSKQAAEQSAAQEALKFKQWDDDES